MSNAAHEPRRWTLVGGASEHGLRVFVAAKQSAPCYAAPGEEVPVIEASAYDALLAERDALRAAADLSPDNASLEGTIAILDEWRYKENNEPFPLSGSKVRELCESVIALRAELAALRIENDEADTLNTRLSRILTDTAHVLKGTPEALHSHSWADLAQVAAALKEKAERLHGALVTFNWNGDDICRVCWGWRTHKETHHAPDCPAHPAFLTTSAAESREE